MTERLVSTVNADDQHYVGSPEQNQRLAASEESDASDKKTIKVTAEPADLQIQQEPIATTAA